MKNILNQAKSMQNELVEWRRYLHQNPELGMDLPITTAFVTDKLRSMGYEPQIIGKSGITATVTGNPQGKCFLLRADMDALPVVEESGASFSSCNMNMHACGHDFHTTMLLGAAKILKDNEDKINGTVKLMFQPAEEIMQGAKAMVDDGILENPTVDAAAMLHVMSGLPFPSGTIMVPGAGAFSAASDLFEINIQGKGGHGAMPYAAIDPLNIASHIHIALQALNSREVSATETAIVTVGYMGGGETSNVIPDTAVLKGTVRTFDEDVRQFILKRIPEIANGVAQTFRGSVDVKIIPGCASVVIDGDVAENIRSGLSEVFGDYVMTESSLSKFKMHGSEDFSFVSSKVPSVMLSVSTGCPNEGYEYYLHHPKVTFNEEVLCSGAAMYAISAINWLK